MMRNCWIVTYEDFHGEGDKYVFYKKESAVENIMEDFKNTLHDLKKLGYDPTTMDGTYRWVIFVPNTDINYEWNLEISTIR